MAGVNDWDAELKDLRVWQAAPGHFEEVQPQTRHLRGREHLVVEV